MQGTWQEHAILNRKDTLDIYQVNTKYIFLRFGTEYYWLANTRHIFFRFGNDKDMTRIWQDDQRYEKLEGVHMNGIWQAYDTKRGAFEWGRESRWYFQHINFMFTYFQVLHNIAYFEHIFTKDGIREGIALFCIYIHLFFAYFCILHFCIF